MARTRDRETQELLASTDRRRSEPSSPSSAGAAAPGLSEHQALSQIGKIRTIPDRLSATVDPLVVAARSAEVLGAVIGRCYSVVGERMPRRSLPPDRRRRLQATHKILVGLADLIPLATEAERARLADMMRETMALQAAASLPTGEREPSP